jgi:hypothetical protein
VVEKVATNLEVGILKLMIEVTIEEEVIIIALIITTRQNLSIIIKEVADSTNLKLKITFTEGEEELQRTT